MNDRDRIAQQHGGEVTIDAATDAVERHPNHYPGLAPFLTWDDQEAIRKCHEQEVSYALACVMVREIVPEQTEPIRALVAVRNTDGDYIWEPVQVVLREANRRAAVFAEIEQELRQVTEKMAEFRRLDAVLHAPQLATSKK